MPPPSGTSQWIVSMSSTCRAKCCAASSIISNRAGDAPSEPATNVLRLFTPSLDSSPKRSPEHIAWCSQIRAVPFKRFNRNELSYMDKPEMDAILAAPDRRTEHGRRDHALLLFL